MLLYNLPYSLEIYLKFSKMNCRSQAAYNISNVRSKLKEHLIRSLSTCLLLNIDAWAFQDLPQLSSLFILAQIQQVDHYEQVVSCSYKIS